MLPHVVKATRVLSNSVRTQKRNANANMFKLGTSTVRDFSKRYQTKSDYVLLEQPKVSVFACGALLSKSEKDDQTE